MAIAKAEVRTALYRFYDADEALLYAGITNDPWRRWREHVLEKSWYPDSKYWTVTWYDSEPRARAAERRAIKGQRPRFNIADAPEPIPVKFTVRAETVIVACALWLIAPYLVILLPVHWFSSWLEPVAPIYLLTAPVAALLVGLVHAPGLLRRFASWFDRHVEPPKSRSDPRANHGRMKPTFPANLLRRRADPKPWQQES